LSRRHATRAARLQRIALVSDALARSAELTAAERRQVLLGEQERLETVERYASDYGGTIRTQEIAGQSVGSLRMYREFSGWLSGLAQDQQNQVAQAEFLLAAALEEAQGKRTFANALERAAEKSGQLAAKEARAAEQKVLDELVRPRSRTAVAWSLQSKLLTNR
jgi:flagellar biosynthesis chaperone FliJ